MPERKSMRRIKECLRLYYEAHQSQSAVARALGVARSTVWDYLQRVKAGTEQRAKTFFCAR